MLNVIKFHLPFFTIPRIISFKISLFLCCFFFISLFSSGTIESEDGWLYLSVSRNMYYQGKVIAAPREYDTQKNVNMNSILKEDGSWRAPGAVGYSLVMVPAVALSDLYHQITGIPTAERFPLETDWSFLFFASITNAFLGAVLVIVLFEFFNSLLFTNTQSLYAAVLTFFFSNLFPLSTHGFAHTLFLIVFLLAATSVNKLALTKHWVWFVTLLLCSLALPFTYNVSALLAWIGLGIYFVLKNKWIFQKLTRIQMVFVIVPIVLLGMLIMVPRSWVYVSNMEFYPTVMIEGVWGLLISPGKSMFIYSPLLALPLMFWQRLQIKKYQPELITAGVLLFLYLFFYSQAHLKDAVGNLFGIWHGGASWGPRYISSLIPWLMIFSMLAIFSMRKIERIIILFPLLLISVWIQLVGILVPYQTQYRGLSYSVNIKGVDIPVYEYASFIPRYSPIITQSKELIKRLLEFQSSIDQGEYNLAFYDGFKPPVEGFGKTFRAFSNDGHIYWDNKMGKIQDIELTMELMQPSYASETAIINIEEYDRQYELSSTVSTKIVLTSNTNRQQWLDLELLHSATDSSSLAAITSMTIENTQINLKSLSYPYLDFGTEEIYTKYPRKYWGNEVKDFWKYWYMRAGVYEQTLDLWWVRYSYYWDLPQKFITTLFIIFSVCLLSSFSVTLYLGNTYFRQNRKY